MKTEFLKVIKQKSLLWISAWLFQLSHKLTSEQDALIFLQVEVQRPQISI